MNRILSKLPFLRGFLHFLSGSRADNTAGGISGKYPMTFYEKYRFIDGITDHTLSAPWRYPAKLLQAGGDYPDPLGQLLAQLRNDGHNVDAALFQFNAMRHWLENHK